MSNPPAANLLIEIGTEELPPKTLGALGRAFAAACVDGLHDLQLIQGVEDFRWFATPRRLAVWIPGVRKRQSDQQVERRGPAVAAAFDPDGNPTRAASGFARSCGVDIADLDRLGSDQGEWLVFRETRKGETAGRLIPACVGEAVKRLPIARRMRWSDLETEFVRPVHWLTILHGAGVVKCELLSVTATAATRGHRFHHPGPIRLRHADDYETALRKPGIVIADFDRRRGEIVRQTRKLAAKVAGEAVLDAALLDEITGIVEWPRAILGEFEKDFLAIPPEVLISSMRDHQKYIHLIDHRGRLLPYFVTVSNIKSKSPKRIRNGNESVLRARLSDARFFWEQDRARRLWDRRDALGQVLFHKALGSVKDKTERMRALAANIARRTGAGVELCQRAALLAKVDLVTDMVGEFPELQGIMGGYYAEHDGEDAQVAAACAEHYLPRFAGDDLPGADVGKVVALADRIDSLVGIFLTGEEPSGDKDPYALRRTALGLLRIMIEGNVDLDLRQLVADSLDIYRDRVDTVAAGDVVANRVFEFIVERLKAYYGDQGFVADEIAAVAARRPPRPLDFDRRLRAVARFRKLEAAANLAAANKRIRNILRKSGVNAHDSIDASLLADASERVLVDALDRLDETTARQFAAADYDTGLTALSALREPVDVFFDRVLVMAEDEALRKNRLAILRRVQNLFLRVADLSELHMDGNAPSG